VGPVGSALGNSARNHVRTSRWRKCSSQGVDPSCAGRGNPYREQQSYRRPILRLGRHHSMSLEKKKDANLQAFAVVIVVSGFFCLRQIRRRPPRLRTCRLREKTYQSIARL